MFTIVQMIGKIKKKKRYFVRTSTIDRNAKDNLYKIINNNIESILPAQTVVIILYYITCYFRGVAWRLRRIECNCFGDFHNGNQRQKKNPRPERFLFSNIVMWPIIYTSPFRPNPMYLAINHLFCVENSYSVFYTDKYIMKTCYRRSQYLS